MIKKASELDFTNKNYVMLITGRPGVGKTTLAESAPDPILIDLENGIDRVEAVYRSDVSIVGDDIPDSQKYEAFLADIKSPEMARYKTIIIDSLGKLVDLMTPVVVAMNPQYAQKDGRTLSLKGWGAIKVLEKDFFDLVKSLHKNLIIIAHVSETNDGDVIKTRINVPGAIKDSIWDDVDIGGFIEFNGKERWIYFTPTERFDAKGTHGITGGYALPVLKKSSDGGKFADNHFLTDLFNQMNENLNADAKKANEGKALYDEAMKIKPEIEAATNADELNAAVKKVFAVRHGLTSKNELAAAVNKKAAELGLTYDKKTKRYSVPVTS